MNDNISDKDKKDWEDFLSNEEDLFDKDEVLQKNKVKRVRTFDFHGYSLDQANKKIKDLQIHLTKSGLLSSVIGEIRQGNPSVFITHKHPSSL